MCGRAIDSPVQWKLALDHTVVALVAPARIQAKHQKVLPPTLRFGWARDITSFPIHACALDDDDGL